ncbi:hypothetical protein [Virgibacillus sp. DJP39]|uniref:hypothetical protein n=1 Tax=Virgibacillus sp. DJP39 TaxID=3409790 RepID=UPI003BB6B220
MTVIIWLSITLIFLYTIGFSITLWKSKNKIGSCATALIASLIAVIPFFVKLV